MDYPKLKKYRILRKICRKLCFDLYEVEALEDGQRLFIKVLNENFSHDQKAQDLFFRSARMGSLVNHQDAVKVFRFTAEKELSFIVSEAIKGTSLTLHIHENYPAPLQDCAAAIIEMAKVMRTAHLNGVIHGLLNPDSIYIDQNSLKIDNFGFSWIIPNGGIEEAEAVYLSYFIAPETYIADAQIDGRADIYSLGAIFLLMLVEDFAFNGKVESNVKQHSLRATIPYVRKVYPENYPLLEHILTKCLQNSPQNRYLNCKELIADLSKLTAENPGSQFSKSPSPKPTEIHNKFFS